MIEVRGHARGGQGMVTAFEILAKIFGKSGDFQVQSFPAFGVERTGAPIQAFLRIARNNIYNRSNVYAPHLVVVFDESLIGQIPVFDGLRENGTILLNTERKPTEFTGQAKNVFTVPATKISFSKGLGSKSLPIVNAAMIGAFIRMLDADIQIAAEIVRENVPAKSQANVEATFLAYHSIVKGAGTESCLPAQLLDDKVTEPIVPAKDKSPKVAPGVEQPKLNMPLTPAWSQPMSLNKTGNWRALVPKYETRPAPCTSHCPAGTDVRLFIQQTSEGKFRQAYETIYLHNPFAGTCGRVCPHFCQHNCNRLAFDEELNIGGIERFLGDFGFTEKIEPVEIVFKEKIAVIGSGPAGLTAALRLRQKGFSTTVFEALSQAGGMMRSGIPEFRLPNNILDREIECIKEAGVEIRLNCRVAVSDLEENYSAILVAVGSHISSRMNIPHEELALEGIGFLRDFKLNGDAQNIKSNDKVMIIGGGNTAIDVARTTLRLGAEPVIYYRRTRNEMPAIHHEVAEAEAEGVKIKFLTAPAAFAPGTNGIINVTTVKMELGEPDESGRRRPVAIAGSETIEKVNRVILAVGQTYDEYVFSNSRVNVQQGKVDFQTNVPVFCCGDMAWGGTVTEAIGSGNSVAKEVVAFLKNEDFNRNECVEDIVLPDQLNFAYYLPTPGHHNKMRENAGLKGDLSEVIAGLTRQQTLEEATRCMHCGDCFRCGNCLNYCPDAAIHLDEANRLRIDYDFCKGCGICFQECPCASMSLTMEEV